MKLVTVCAACLRASCWNYDFPCEQYKIADVVEKTVAELRALALEHEDHYMRATSDSGAKNGPAA